MIWTASFPLYLLRQILIDAPSQAAIFLIDSAKNLLARSQCFGLIDEMPETMIEAESRSETIALEAAESEMAEDEKDTPTTQPTNP